MSDEFRTSEFSSNPPEIEGRKTGSNVYQWTYAELSNLKRKVDEQEERIGKIKDESEALKDNIRDDNTKSLAVFVAFFTFISLSFSILPDISHPLVLIGIALLILGSLTLFILLLVWTLDSKKILTLKQVGIGALAISLLISGVYVAWFGYSEQKDEKYQDLNEKFYNKEQVESLFEEKKQEWLSDFKLCLQQQTYWQCIRQ